MTGSVGDTSIADGLEATHAGVFPPPRPWARAHEVANVLAGGAAWAGVGDAARAETAVPRRRTVVRATRGAPGERAHKAARLVARNRDESTGLVDRQVLLEEIDRAISRGRPVALLAVGLDLAGMTGQNIGDEELLAALAHRVSSAVRGGDPVANFGGDGLMVLLDDVPHRELALSVARRLLAAASGPVSMRGRELDAAASVGVVLSAELAGATIDEIVHAAAQGRHQARALGGDRVEIVSTTSSAGVARARQWPRRELERAVQHAEFVAHYQPVVSVDGADLVGFEALMRWEHPQLGLLTPPSFVGAAESTGLLVRIGTEIMRQSLRQLGRWIDRFGDRPLNMAINFSSRQLAALDLVDTVVDLVRASGIPPQQVVLEIGEASMTVEDEQLAGTLVRLREAGIVLSLDDFGSGTASFEALGRVPFDIVKLDRKIVSAMNGSTGAAVAHAMVRLGHSLGKTVVAEGVETARELAMLRQMGCDHAQGHLFSKPKPATAVDALLDRWAAAAP